MLSDDNDLLIEIMEIFNREQYNKGKPQWKTEYGPEWTGSYPGTRTTPTIDSERLYIISGQGRLSCFSLKTRDLIWKGKLSRS